MKLRVKRSLFLVHRWFGVAMCMLFALWFATGIIMMYVEYPELTEEERLDALAPLDLAAVAVSVDDAIAVSGLERRRGYRRAVAHRSTAGVPPARRRRRAGGRLRRRRHSVRGPFAGDGPAAVQHSGFAAAGQLATYERTIDVDQWTVSSILDEHRPLHRVAIGDERGTVVYVSSSTGQIVRDTHRAERAWNWLGSTIHWIYPFQLRRHSELWTNLLIYLSVAGIVSVVTGAVIGVLRLRLRQRYRGRDVTPYAGAAKWHHVLGLCCLVFLSTFIFSGLMSMSPWGLIRFAELRRCPGPPLFARRRRRGVVADDRVADATARRRRQGSRVAARRGPVAMPSSAGPRRTARSCWTALTVRAALAELRRRIESAVAALLPDAAIVAAAPVEEYDDYYYTRHNRYRPLPAYRVTFDDAESTWFYVDWSTGAVVLRYTTAARVQRWLYNGLHSLDFGFLLRRGVLWDGIVIVLSIVGFAFAVTSVVVGWRRVARSATTSPRSRINDAPVNR